MCEYNAITLDTSILEGKNFNLENGILTKMEQYARLGIDFVLSEIVYKEMIAHMENKTGEAISNYNKIVSDYNKMVNTFRFYKLDTYIEKKIEKIQEVNISAIVKKRVGEYQEKTQFEVIPITGTDATEVFKTYFERKPPFSEKKKEEFPDAFALQSLANWAKQKKKKILVVSKDKDWEEFCQLHSELNYEEDLATVLDNLNKEKDESVRLNISKLLKDSSFLSILDESIKYCSDKIEANVEADSYLQYEVDGVDVECENFDYVKDKKGDIDFNVIDIDDDNITIIVPVEFSLKVTADFDLYVYDSIDKDNVGLGGCSRTKDVEFATNVIINIGYYKDNPSESSIDEIYLERDDINIYFHDLDLDDKDDYCEEM